MAPEHMLHAVGDIKHAYANAFRRLVQRVEKHSFAFFMNQVTLFEERIFCEKTIIQSPGVFGQPKGGVETLLLREINRVRQRIRDRQGGVHGVDVHRRRVKFQFRLDRLKVKPTNSLDADADPRTEFQFHPLRVFALGDRDAPAIHMNVRISLRDSLLDPERRAQLHAGVSSQSVWRARNVRMENLAILLERYNDTIACGFAIRSARRVKGKCSLGPLDVRHAHSGQQNSRELFRRECDWHPDYGTKYTGFGQIMPERNTLAEGLNLGTRQGDHIATDL